MRDEDEVAYLDSESAKYWVLDKVELPLETSGVCIRWKRCGNTEVDLADGYCVDCWDKGFDIHRNRLLD